MKRFVYLAGPINGCDLGEANDWRREVDKLLSARSDGQIIGISPLRCEPLIGARYGFGYPEDPRFGTSKAIVSKNLFDVQNCDITLAYFPTPPEGRPQSGGTMAEVSWAFALGKRAIIVSEDPYIINHPVYQATAGWLVPTLDEGVDVCVGILGGYTGGKNV